METELKTKGAKPKAQVAQTQNQEPKRISKAWQWRLDNPNGIFTVVDWRAVNK